MLIDYEDFNLREAYPTNLDEFVQIRWDCGQAMLMIMIKCSLIPVSYKMVELMLMVKVKMVMLMLVLMLVTLILMVNRDYDDQG